MVISGLKRLFAKHITIKFYIHNTIPVSTAINFKTQLNNKIT